MEILCRYESGERTFHGLQIEADENGTDPEFRGANLSGADFEGAGAFGYAYANGEYPGDETGRPQR